MNDCGWVEEKELRDFCFSLGINKSSYYKWLKDAKKAELFKYVFSGGKHVLLVTSYKKAYEIFEVSFTDTQAVMMPVSMLFKNGKRVKGIKKGWMANVWAASTKVNFQDKTISQEKKARLTGVPASTQRRWDRRADIKRNRSFSTSPFEATTATVQAFQDNSDKKGIFVFSRNIGWCTPSKSHVSTGKIVPVGSHRSMRKLGLNHVPEAVSKSPRLFCETDEETKNAVDKPSEKRDGIYVLKSTGELGGVNVWSFDVGK
jgi:hypothetical protein